MSKPTKNRLAWLAALGGLAGLAAILRELVPLLSTWSVGELVTGTVATASCCLWWYEHRRGNQLQTIAQSLHSELVRVTVALDRRKDCEVATWSEICEGKPIWNCPQPPAGVPERRMKPHPNGEE